MIGFHTNDQDRYLKLREYKRLLVSAANETAFRSKIRRNGTEGTGPFLVEVRKALFGKLKEVESATGWRLITPEEEACIREHWMIDESVHDTANPIQSMLWDFDGMTT